MGGREGGQRGSRGGLSMSVVRVKSMPTGMISNALGPRIAPGLRTQVSTPEFLLVDVKVLSKEICLRG